MATLTFDPITEGTANAPLELFASAADGVFVESMAFPAPPLETATVGSIDTEGELVAARAHRNRQVQLTVGVREPAGLAAATNLVTESVRRDGHDRSRPRLSERRSARSNCRYATGAGGARCPVHAAGRRDAARAGPARSLR